MKNLLVAMLAIAISIPALAVPVKPGIVKVTQSDGTIISVETVGDEHHHFMLTTDGVEISRSAVDGNFYYVGKDGISNVLAHDKASRSSEEISFVESVKATVEQHREATIADINKRVISKVSGAMKAAQVAGKGKVRIPIILVEYADKKMTFGKNELYSHFNEGSKSARQYFIDQSNGQFAPQFDVFGVYTLSNNRAEYGGNGSNGADKGVGKMVAEACELANASSSINWKDYDNNGDSVCDVVIVVYAGVGEAQASTTVPESVWPCQWSLSGAAGNNDGPGTVVYNGVTVDKFAVFNEVRGSNDNSTTMDGIGTFCHEFSHCLGLPDFYEVSYSHNYYGMGFWSVMCRGCYNNDGETPVGYSAYEKSFLNWATLETPAEGETCNLPVLNAGSDRAIKIVNDANENEYFVLENRRKQGWDSYIKDEGLMITHVTYVSKRWMANNVNDAAVQLMTIVPADNSADLKTESTDLFGETNHSFTDISTPAAELNLGEDTPAYPKPTGAFLGKPVTDIQIAADGTVSFVYCDKTAPKMTVNDKEVAFGKIVKGKSVSKQISFSGKNIHGTTTLELNDASGSYRLSKTAFTADEITAGVTVDVTFSPVDFSEHTATIKVVNAECLQEEITLSGAGSVEAMLPVMKTVDDNAVTTTSFVAEWDDATVADYVDTYSLRVNSDRDPSLISEANFSGLTKVTKTNGSLANVIMARLEYLPEGWDATTSLYVADGALVFGGKIYMPNFNANGYDKMSVVVKGRSFSPSKYGSAKLTLISSKGTASQTMTSDEMTEYTMVVDCADVESLTISTSSYPVLESIMIYAGDMTKASHVSAVESGDASHRLIDSIEEKSVEVDGLKPSTQYTYQVKAYYKDGTSSEWSEARTVTTKDAPVSVMTMFDNLEVGESVNIPSGQLSCVGLIGSNILVTKDENACPSKDVIAPGQVDYLMTYTTFMTGDVDFDQSGWMLVELENELTLSQFQSVRGRKLSSVNGVVSDVENPTITATITPTGQGDNTDGYAMNTYIVANFKGTQQSKTMNADGTYTTYFFVQPKPNEIAIIKWAMWNEAEQCFTTPSSVGSSNKVGLEGSFRADFSKYTGTQPELVDGAVYSFTGLVTVVENVQRSARRTASTDGTTSTVAQTDYVVYPLGGWTKDAEINGNVVTDVDDVNASKDVAEVVYYNMLGAKSATPFSGINVVVTTYTDGTQSTAKVRK